MSGKFPFLKKPLFGVLVFFAVYLMVGLLTVKDYGISWDEKVNRGNGAVTVKYVLGTLMPGYLQSHPELDHLPRLMDYQDRDYGVAFEVFLVLAEKAAGVQEDTAALFYLRHLLTFLFCFAGSVFFFLMVKKRFNSVAWGLGGAALYILSPRLFADSFYNSKDAVFMAAFAIGMYFLFEFLEKRTLKTAILFGFAAALATDIRIMGVLLPFIAGGFLAWEWITAKDQRRNRLMEARSLMTLLAAFILFTVIMWPYLWSNPPGHFLYALKAMSKFRWEGKVLFMGQLYNGNQLPFYYVPVWIAISSPVLAVLAFLPGVWATLSGVVRNKLKLYSDAEGRRDVIALSLFALPVMATIVLGSTLYSGWRQLFFTYPAFLLVALAGLHYLLGLGKNLKAANSIAAGLVGLQCLSLVWSLAVMHPYGNVYFNFLAGGNPVGKYEMDYWGLAYREGLEKVAETDKRPEIFVKVESYPGKTNLTMLPAADQQRVHYVESADSADYFIGASRPDKLGNAEEIYSVAPNGWQILTVLKLR